MAQLTAPSVGALAATLFFSHAGDAQEAYRHQQRLESFAESVEGCTETDRLKRLNEARWAELAAGSGGELRRPPTLDLCEYITQSADAYLRNNERIIWTEKSTTVWDAVWETVFVPLHDERLRVEFSARNQRVLEQATRRRTRRNRTQVEVEERSAIEMRLEQALGIDQSTTDALTQYASDAVYNEDRNKSLVQQQLICDRANSFETPASYGRAFAEVTSISRSERERVVNGLDEIIGVEAKSKLVGFALSAAGPTIPTVDVEASVSQWSLAELADMVGLICRAR